MKGKPHVGRQILKKLILILYSKVICDSTLCEKDGEVNAEMINHHVSPNANVMYQE